MEQNRKITSEDLRRIKTEPDIAIPLIREYSKLYLGKIHYDDHLGKSCCVSVNGTINAIINSTIYLEGIFVLPDEIHVAHLADWFIENKPFHGDREILIYYMAFYLKRKVNSFYKDIKQGVMSTSFAVSDNAEARKELENKSI